MRFIDIYSLKEEKGNQAESTVKTVFIQIAFDSAVIVFDLSTFQYSDPEKREELQHDMENAIPNLEAWKSHILRAVHQDAAKNAVIDKLASNQVLLIMDWAMKFLPTCFRETQRDWFGKKGKPWHVCVAITKAANEEIEVLLRGRASIRVRKFHYSCLLVRNEYQISLPP